MNKNSFTMIVGDSGEGKSYTALKFAEIVEPKFDPSMQVVYSPEQFLNIIKYATEEKKIKCIVLDEAHVTIPARLWLSFSNLALGLVTTTFRRLRSLCVFVVAPDISYVEKMIRDSCNFYAICERRVRKNDQYVFVKFYRLIRNRFDLERTKTHLKYIDIYYAPEDRVISIDTLRVSLPSEHIIQTYEECSFKFKKMLLERKLLELKKMIDRKLDIILSVEEAIEALQKSEELREALIMYDKKGNAKLKKAALNYFKLTDVEFLRLQKEVANLFSKVEK
jgi:hypothetical protein